METIKKDKSFDAVSSMRESRDKISLETQDMTIEQLKSYIDTKLRKGKKELIGEK